MRFFIVAIALAAATSTSAAVLKRQSGLPDCAIPCLNGPNVNYFGCSATDDTCLCANQQFISTSTSCIESACSGSDLTTAEQFSQGLCEAVGEPISSSASGSAASSSSAAAPATSASSTASSSTTAASPTSTAPSGTVSQLNPTATSSTSGASALTANLLVGIVAVGVGAFLF